MKTPELVLAGIVIALLTWAALIRPWGFALNLEGLR